VGKCLMRVEGEEIILEKEQEESIITFSPQFHEDSRHFRSRRNSGVWCQPCVASNPNSD